MSSELDQLLRDASRLLGCETVSIRCECANLETVYVERDDDQLLVTDRHQTYRYLQSDEDETYSLLADQRARAVCRRHGVELDATCTAQEAGCEPPGTPSRSVLSSSP